MNKKVKIWFIVAISLIFLGCIVFIGAMTMGKWDFDKLSMDSKYQTKNYEINEEFKDVFIKADTADIIFALSEDEKCTVICYEQEKMSHAVSVTDKKLKIEINDTRKWYEHIGINFKTPKITVNLPLSEYQTLLIKSKTGDVKISKDFTFNSIDVTVSTGDVVNNANANSIKIKASTGDICTKDVSVSSLSLSVSTGKVKVENTTCEEILVSVTTGKTSLENITCKSLISDGSTGEVVLKNVIASDKFDIKRSTGDVKLDGCDAGEIYIKTSTGDVKGTLKSEKIFIVNTDTGRKDVPKTITGGRCEITTDTGDIIISIM